MCTNNKEESADPAMRENSGVSITLLGFASLISCLITRSLIL